MSLHQLMTAISLLSKEANQRDEELHKKYGLELGIAPGEPATEAYLSEAKHIRVPLAEYLNSLGMSDVKKLVTLMYAGRDTDHFRDAGSLAAYHDALNFKDKKKEDYIRIMLEKINSLSIYFDSVIKLLEKMEINPDNELAQIS